MAFGIYVHTPYCIQRCKYCDFATYEQSQILPPSDYLKLLSAEIDATKHFFPKQATDTIYFGGGTPSLLPAEQIVSVIDMLDKAGFPRGPGTEITIEINPATINEEKMRIYLDRGINRFSVGAQTFNDELLKRLGREHDAEQTMSTLRLLDQFNANFTFDILFALPGQTIDHLKNDLRIGLDFGANHVSTYCLTVPNSNPLSIGRPPEADQIEMFHLLDHELTHHGFRQYEISNYARPGFESKHNLLYWTDEPYWGIGLSAHSYSPNKQSGIRFWNPSSIKEYEQFWSTPLKYKTPLDLGLERHEALAPHQYATDLCHTSLRMLTGISHQVFSKKFSKNQLDSIYLRLDRLVSRGLVEKIDTSWKLSREGIYLSNLVFEELTFLEKEFPAFG